MRQSKVVLGSFSLALLIAVGLLSLWGAAAHAGAQPHIAALAEVFLRVDLESTPGLPKTQYGQAVAFAGDLNGDGYSDIVLGAPVHVPGDAVGRVCVFYGGPGGLRGHPCDWETLGEQRGAQFGATVSGAGDVNGDGYDDLLVAAPEFGFGSGVGNNYGRLYLYLGSYTGITTSTYAWAYSSDQRDTYLGRSAAAAGDLNGDGFADVIVGVPRYSGAVATAGRVYVFYGSASGLTTALSATLDGLQTGAQFGYAVAGAGDLNGDGYDDIVVGAPYHNPISTTLNAGAAFVFFGSGSGVSMMVSQTLLYDQANANFGMAISGAGDVNGDGCREVLVGAPGYAISPTLLYVGRALLFYGALDGTACVGLQPAPGWMAQGSQAGGRFGAAVAGGGNLNADGYADVVVGAPKVSIVGPNSKDGTAYVFMGSAAGLRTSPAWQGSPGKKEADYGISVGIGGDTNGDGFDDLVIGAPLYFLQTDPYGKVFTYLGAERALGWVSYLPLTLYGE